MKNNTTIFVTGILVLSVLSACGRTVTDSHETNNSPMASSAAKQKLVVSYDGASMDTMVPLSSRSLKLDKVGAYAGDMVTLMIQDLERYPAPVNLATQWSITDANNSEIFSQVGGYSLEWTPQTPGSYTASVVISQGEVDTQLSEPVYVLKKPLPDIDLNAKFLEMDDKLVGTWVGNVSDSYSREDVSITFSENGSLLVSHFNPAGMSSAPFPYPPFAPYPPGMYPFDMPGPTMMPPFMPYDMAGSFGFFKEKGNYELLDIWANGEGEGTLTLSGYSTPGFSNLRRVRFNTDFSMLFFEVSRDMYSSPQVYVLSKAENMEPINDLATLKASLLGDWLGQVYAPWTEPYDVKFGFSENSYSAKGISFSRKIYADEMTQRGAFYFGALTQESQPYTISDFNSGTASGTISLALDNGDVVSGTLSNIEMSIDRSMLVFTFMHYGKYGPMQYLLKRQ